MKKNLVYISFAAIAMTFASCVNENLDLDHNNGTVEDVKIVREFVLDLPTRTAFDETHTQLKWSAGDQFGFLATDGTAVVDHNVAISTPEEGNTVSIPVSATATVGYAYYPFIAGNAANPIEKSTTTDGETTYADSYLNAAKLFVSPSQIQKRAGEFYGAMLPMYAKVTIPAESDAAPTPILFKPSASILAVNIYGNADEKVSYVKFTPASGNISGNREYDWTAEPIAEPTLRNGKGYVAVSLENPYSVPAAKPADNSGYIYMAVVPGSYVGGKFTVVTETSVYEFETSATFDLTDVYKPVAVPVNLAGKTPSSTYLYYENFATATAHLENVAYKDYTGTEVRTAHGALNIGTKAAVGTLITPAFAFLGDETKDVKITFHANGWSGTNKLSVTASVGTVVDGTAISLTKLLNTDGSDRFSMDKSAPITVYVKGATKETKLTFTNDASDASDSKRFVIDDVAVEEFVPALEVAYTLDMEVEKKGATSFGQINSGLLTNNGVSWTLVNYCPNNSGSQYWALGNSGSSFANSKLNDTYIKVGSPMGYTTDTYVVAAAISESKMKNVEKVVVYNDKFDVTSDKKQYPTDISLVYSLDGNTYELIGETQTYNAIGGGSNVWIFEPKGATEGAYFAIVIYKEKARAKTDGLKADFYAVPEI